MNTIVKKLRITIVLTLQNVLHVHRACVTLHGNFCESEVRGNFEEVSDHGYRCQVFAHKHTQAGDIAEPATWQSPTTMRSPKKGDD